MALKRTTVYVEAEDLAVIKEAAAREGVAEAEIIREAIHLAAMARRTWDEPFFTTTYRPVGTASADDVWAEKAEQYEQAKQARQNRGAA